MRELALVGVVALFFALGAYYTSEAFGWFGWANLLGGALALLVAAGLSLRRARGFGTSAGRRVLVSGIVWVVAAIAVAIGVERLAAHSGWQLDWTAERRYTLSDATLTTLAELPSPVSATLFHDVFDTRTRSTRLLLKTLAEHGPIEVRERVLDESPAEADRYGVTSSNSVVFTMDGAFETVERPTEGSLYEALRSMLQRGDDRVVYVARGAGEGNFARFEDTGFSGLAHALEVEGFTLREMVTAAITEIPEDADLVLLVSPQRRLRDAALDALEAYLERGGSLVALLDPGTDTGVEELLERWGFELPDAVVIDPASGPVEGGQPGVNPIVFNYAQHPVTSKLDSSRMTFFRGARPVLAAHKPEPNDELSALAFASRRAWLAENVEAVLEGLAPERPEDAREDYWPVLAVGRFPRAAGETRIVVFGDSEFASNANLRALYNADLLLNAIQWAVRREPSITLRPKALAPDQFPLTPQQSLQMLYGVGLLIPELTLIGAALTWARRRGA